jgi:uncharacterized pyridoxamine 5'-phosphate oxidase family protein
MAKDLQFFADSKVLNVLTVKDILSRVRSFEISFDINGKINIITNSEKDVFKEIIANSNVKISSTKFLCN